MLKEAHENVILSRAAGLRRPTFLGTMPSSPIEPALNQSAAPKSLRPRYLDVSELLDDLDSEVVCRDNRFLGPASLKVQPIDPERRRIALAISGGGAKGAYSAGTIEALLPRMRERGLTPDLLVGTSAGALNGYGVFVEALGLENSQLREDPDIRQPYATFIASIWSLLGRERGGTSRWVVGRRSWMVDLASRGLHTPLRRWSLFGALALAVILFNPFLFVGFMLLLGLDGLLPEALRGADGEVASLLALLGSLSLIGLMAMVYGLIRSFGHSLFRDTPLLRLLANTGHDGDLREPFRWAAEQTRDRAQSLSREIVREWYARSHELPELIITGADITIGRECLFTLVRPETYRALVDQGWMAVQLDSEDDAAKRHHEIEGALFVSSRSLLECVVASSAVPGAFPSQRLKIYSSNGTKTAWHRFLDGGVLNNSPLHLAIDAGASHILSLELDPLREVNPLDAEDSGEAQNLLEAGVATFAALLDRAVERDMRRTITWNRFLAQRPDAALEPRNILHRKTAAEREKKRIVPIYRIAPSESTLGASELDGNYESGRLAHSIRDIVRQGAIDLKGKMIWRATLQAAPSVAEKTK